MEAVSCDEMLVDCTDLLASTGATPEEFATLLRREIYDKTGCTASAGLGGKILLARLATRTAKPNGQFYLTADAVPDFIVKQSVRDLPGVGYSMTKKLTSLKVTTCGDLQKLTLASLQKEFGPKTGQSLYQYCRGQDDRQLKMERERKSVSAEINYGIRFQKAFEAERFLSDLSEEVSSRLQNINMRGKTITLKVMVRKENAPIKSAKFMGHGKCNNLSKSSSLPVATDDHTVIANECIAMYRTLRVKAEDLRGVGIQTHRLEATTLGRSSTRGDNQSKLSFAVATKNLSPTPSKAPVPTSPTDPDEPSPDIDSTGDEEPVLFTSSCPTIIEELERRRNATTELPPLPSLLQFETPPSRRDDKTEPEDYFPSPSQIDPEVLKELPPDIREQIERDMVTKRAHSRSKIIPTNHESHGKPGCSHWPSQESKSTNQERAGSQGCSHWLPQDGDSSNQEAGSDIPANEQREETGTESVTSYSQLDTSFLNALPKELQDELREEYSKKDQDYLDLNVVTAPRLQLRQAKSPSKSRGSTRRSPHKSPSRGSKKSPVFKVPRGRPAGNRNRNKKQSHFPVQKRLTKKAVVRNLDKTVYEAEQNPGQSTAEADPVKETQSEIQSEDGVNLCGAVTIREVRILLAEWLEACPVPQSEDVGVLTEYLGQLVLDRNLEQVDLVLKCFNRKIRKLANREWKVSFNNILTNTQDFIKSIHGSNLKVDWLSAT